MCFQFLLLRIPVFGDCFGWLDYLALLSFSKHRESTKTALKSQMIARSNEALEIQSPPLSEEDQHLSVCVLMSLF